MFEEQAGAGQEQAERGAEGKRVGDDGDEQALHRGYRPPARRARRGRVAASPWVIPR